MNREVALRIALATRTLENTSIAQLLDVLSACTNGELTKKAISNIDIEEFLSTLHQKVDAHFDLDGITDAIRIFRGERDLEALPSVTALEVLPERSIKLAVASNNEDLLDGHFGSCLRFLVYQVNTDGYNLIDIRSMIPTELAEDKNAARTNLIDDCEIVYMVSVGGPAAAKVIRSGIYPIKKPLGETAPQVIEQLQGVMKKSPPPWLAKIMGDSAENRIRFERAEVEV